MAELAIGLRERQKIQRRKRIIAAAQDLFFGGGYANTSMEKIADHAEIGVATVYNYFGTKGALLCEVLQPLFDEMFAAGQAVLAELPKDPVEGTGALIAVYRNILDQWRHKELMAAIIGPGLSAEPVLDAFTNDVETETKDQIRQLVELYQISGAIRPATDPDDAALILFYILNQHFIEFVTQPDMEFATMAGEMERHICFIISAIRG